jgi:hypothetical protein
MKWIMAVLRRRTLSGLEIRRIPVSGNRAQNCEIALLAALAEQTGGAGLFLLAGKGLFPFRWRGKSVLSPDTLAEERRARPIVVEEQRLALAAKYHPSSIPYHRRKVIEGHGVAIGDADITQSVPVDMSLVNGAGPEAEGHGASGRIDVDRGADIRVSLDLT